MTLRFWRIASRNPTFVLLAIALAFVGLAIETLIDTRQENWERARAAGHNLDQAAVEEISRTVGNLDLALQSVVDELQIPAVTRLDPQLRNLVLFDRSGTVKYVSSILVLNADGDVTIDSQSRTTHLGNFADREYFTAQRDHPNGGMFISAPFFGRVSPEWLIAVSRRLAAPNGRFAGEVVGTIRLEPIRAFLASLDLGPHGAITVVRDDGTVLLRLPWDERQPGTNLRGGTVFERARAAPEGQFVATATLDGTPRLITYARVPGTTLGVAASLAVEDIEARWRIHAEIFGLATAVLATALVATALQLRRELSRRLVAEAAAKASEASFRLLAENSGDMVSRLGPDDVQRYVSPASQRILGRKPEELIGAVGHTHVHPNDLDTFTTAQARLRAGQADEEVVVYRARHANGAWIWVETTLRVVFDDTTRQRDGVVAVSRDVTERKTLETELARLATLDGLTGIANRRTFDAKIETEWRRCARAERPLSLLLIDVDRFKALNDHYGHQRGDECLRQVGAVIGQTVRRASDVSARFGGEEFAILLPETDPDGALAVAERVRAEVEALGLPHTVQEPPAAVVTVSIGTATLWPERGVGTRTPADLIETADRCLYEAKRAGRNRVVRSG